jgi:hypothetical protein
VATGKAMPARRGRWDRGSGVGGATSGRKATPARRGRQDRGGCAGSGRQQSGGRGSVNKASGACEWVKQVGVRKFSISDGPTTFGGPMGKTRRK